MAGAAKPLLVPGSARESSHRHRALSARAVILAARTAAGLAQTELAARLKTAQANIARLEKAGSVRSTTTLQRIAKATGHKLIITFTRNA
jgi:ribosome-binding protein aMBF1 (putative translation factor)